MARQAHRKRPTSRHRHLVRPTTPAQKQTAPAWPGQTGAVAHQGRGDAAPWL